MHLVQLLVSGILLGGVYASLAVGLGLVWGVMKVLNVAHASLAILGAYLTWALMARSGLDPILGLLVSVPALFIFGALLQLVAVEPLNRRRNFATESFLLLYGVMIIVENTTAMIWTTDVRLISPLYARETISALGIVVPVGRLLAFTLGMTAFLVTFSLLRFTRFGLAIRATGIDHEAASLMGMNVRRAGMVAFGLGAATAAVAGLGLGLTSSFFPGLQVLWLTKAFLIVVLGGVGSMSGLILAAMLLGIIESFVGFFVSTFASTLVGFVLLVLVLVFRPQGLMGGGRGGGGFGSHTPGK